MKKILSAALALVCIWFATPARAALPDGYTQLEYIESTGTQYIDTGILNNSSIKMNFNVKPSSAVGSYFMGVDQGIIFGTNDGVHFRAVGKNSESSFNTNIFYNIEMYYSGGRRYCVIDGTETLDNIVPSLINAKINIFAAPNNSQIAYYLPWAIKDCKMWDNDTLVRNFIPAKRNSDNVIGMYDTVSGTFFTNAGTGEFIAGPDACNGTIVNYVSATGTGVQNGTPTPDNPIEPVFYQQGNMVLRKVGDYADSYDATTGKITRRIGVKVFNGTEPLTMYYSGYIKSDASDVVFVLPTSSESNDGGGGISNRLQVVSASAGIWQNRGYPNYWALNSRNQLHMNFANEVLGVTDYTQETQSSVIAKAQAYLKSQYDAGTPYVFYYALNTPVQEDWTESQYCNTNNKITIATTKYNETKFSPLNTALQNAISVVDSVVSNTITQAASIATLQAQKQTRPNDIADDNEKCPAGKKCLLVEDASGTPHWYEIVTGRLPDGYTELEYIESTGTQYIKLPSFPNASNINVTADVLQTNGTNEQILFSIDSVQPLYTSGGEWRTWKSGANSFTLTNASGRHLFDIKTTRSGVKYYIDGTQNTNVSATLYTSEVFSAKILFLGARTATTGAGYFWQGRIYSFNSECDGVVCMNLVPALNPDGKIGMYDLVGGRFYENAGTGEFIGGQPVFN